jgi:HSP20 family molecular chaperone IbpA
MLNGEEETAMAREANTEIQKSEQSSVSAVPEQTRPGPVYSPSVDIFENETALMLLADMPGVKPDDLKIDLRENVLTLTGHVSARQMPGEHDVLREYSPGTFFRQFTLSETIDQAKIDAKLSDGVLRLELPKVEKAKPRQISVRAG